MERIDVALDIDVQCFQFLSPFLINLEIYCVIQFTYTLLQAELRIGKVVMNVDLDRPADVRKSVVDARHRYDRMYGVVLLVFFFKIMLVEEIDQVVEMLLALDRNGIQNGHQFSRDNRARSIALDRQR